MIGKVELVLDDKALLGEGPCWTNNQLYWVDIVNKQVCIYNPATKSHRKIQFEQAVSAIVPRTENEAVIVLEDGFYVLDLETEELSLLKHVEADIPTNRFNDGKCDPFGRFWAGTMEKDGKDKQAALYCLDTDGKLSKKLDNVGISNGLDWSIDQTKFFYIDTLTRKVARFDYEIETGSISNRTDIIDFEQEEGMSDGMTIDAEGMLWIAHWAGSKVSRWNPHTGTKLSEVEIPALNITSCTFGGPDLDELYITTAGVGMTDDQALQFPLAGGLFKVRTNVKGLKSNHFKG